MRSIAFAFALCACISGLWAAWLWLCASKGEVATGLPVVGRGDFIRNGINLPGWSASEEDFQNAISEMNDDLMGSLYSLHQSSFFNKRAAKWTAVSVAASGLSAVIGSFG